MEHRVLARTFVLAFLCMASAPWAASITSVSTGSPSVGKYVKEEITVGLGSSYSNPYDPNLIDLSAQFTSPSGKIWKVNGFYDGSAYRIRFAANETGTWSYVVSAKDASSTATSSTNTFTVTSSAYHGWIRPAANKRYLAYDDGTSFFGYAACYPWGNGSGVLATSDLTQMQGQGLNTWIYWNGTYEGGDAGGTELIESTASGLGKYDQGKSALIDKFINAAEADGIGMVLVIWPHDYLCDGTPSGWPHAWGSNPYSSITSAANFYGDANSWNYEQKQYRYIIARWGYSRALEVWQTIDEISGTGGWASDQTTANTWAANIASYFQNNDPFRHPTTGSHGNYWVQGNTANDLPNTEDYTSYASSYVASMTQQLWNNNTKPVISGEMGISGNNQAAVWAAVGNGMCSTPFLWAWSDNNSFAPASIYDAVEKFTAGIDFAHLTNLAQAKVSVSGVEAYGITSAQITFGYLAGGVSGKTLSVSGLPNGTNTVQWWNTTSAGQIGSSTTINVTNGSASLTIPSTSNSDIAYKIIAPTTAVPAPVNQMLLEAENGALDGGAVTVSDATRSNGAYVNLEGGSITWTDSLTKAGTFDLVLSMESPFGPKTNTISIDGDSTSFSVDSSVVYGPDTVATSVTLAAGKHTFLLNANWGWIYVDYLQLVPATTAGVHPVPAAAEAPKLYSVPGGIQITGLVGIRQIKVMDLSGRLLATTNPQAYSATIPLNTHGMLLVSFEDAQGTVSRSKLVLP